MHSEIATHSIYKPGVKLRGFFGPFLLLFCLWLNFPARAQVTLEAGVFIGDAYYLGDLNPDVPFRMAQVAYGAMARYNIDERWSLKLAVTRGSVKGNSEKTSLLPGRNLQFESPVTDFSVMAEFNFFQYFTGSRWNWITPYLYAGIGGFTFQPTSGGVKLRSLGTEGQNVGFDGRKPLCLVGVRVRNGPLTHAFDGRGRFRSERQIG